MGKSRHALEFFSQSFLLVAFHLLLVCISFLLIKETQQVSQNQETHAYQEVEWSRLVNLLSQDNKSIHLQKIKPRWDIFGFELNLQGSYTEFKDWILQLHQQHPLLNWSHIRLSQKSTLIIELEGFGRV